MTMTCIPKPATTNSPKAGAPPARKVLANIRLTRLSPGPPSPYHTSSQINDELSKAGGRKLGSAASPARPSASKNPLAQFQVVLHLITSPYFRSAVVTPSLLADLAGYLTASASPACAGLPGMPEFKTTLMHVLEAICQVGDGWGWKGLPGGARG